MATKMATLDSDDVWTWVCYRLKVVRTFQVWTYVIGNHNCRIFRNQEYRVFGNKEYIGFGNKGAEKMATRNAEICRINITGNGTNPLFIKAYGLS